MDKGKSPGHCGGLPPPCSRYSNSSQMGTSFNSKPESSSSLFTPSASSEASHFGHGSDSTSFIHDISQMPENPPKNLGHRRAHSEILSLPDDLGFDTDLAMVGGGNDGPSFSDEIDEDLFSMYLDMDKFNSFSATSAFQTGEPSGSAAQIVQTSSVANDNVGGGSSERVRVRHKHSQSMDGSMNINPEMLMSGSEEMSQAENKKALSAAKLAELALVDPKRAKRIWANRQSAARSKERKLRYIAELERKVQTLQTEATSLSAQFTLLQRDTNDLTAENNELKLRLQTMEQQVYLQDSLNDTLKDEIQHLKALTGQLMPNGGSMMNYTSFGANQQFHSNNQAMHTHLTAQQLQQLQIHPQKRHNLQPHQFHQFQQQRQPGDSKVRISFPSPGHKDNESSDFKPPETKG